MEKISLNYNRHIDKSLTPKDMILERYKPVPDMEKEELYAKLVKLVNSGEKVYIQYSENHAKRPNSIARVKKITGDAYSIEEKEHYRNRWDDGETYMAKIITYGEIKLHLVWDDNKRTGSFPVSYYDNHSDFFYLPNYDGPTVFTEFDPADYAKKNDLAPRDRLNNILTIGDTVIYNNARYGSGSCLDFGNIVNIKYKPVKSDSIIVEVIVETIAIIEGVRVQQSIIKHPSSSIMKLNDTDLMNEAFINKLTITQQKG